MEPTYSVNPWPAAAVALFVGIAIGSGGSFIWWGDRAGPIGQTMLSRVGFVPPLASIVDDKAVEASPSSPPASMTSGVNVPKAIMPETPSPAQLPTYEPAPLVVQVAAPTPVAPADAPPTAEDVKQALMDQLEIKTGRIQQGAGGRDVRNNPIAGMQEIVRAYWGDSKVQLQDFNLIAVEKAVGQPGWIVDYSARIDISGSGFGGQIMAEITRSFGGSLAQARVIRLPEGRWQLLPLRR